MDNRVALLGAIDTFLEASREYERAAVLGPIEREMTLAIARAFRKQGRVFLGRFGQLADTLPGALTESEWIELLELAQIETRDLFVSAATDGAPLAIAAGIRRAADDIGLPETVLGAAKTWPALLTVEGLRKLLRVGAGAGGPPGLFGALAGGAEMPPVAVVLGIQFGLRNPRAVEYISRVGAALVTKIDETTRDYIRTVVTRGVREGQSYNEMAKAITERYRQFAVGLPQKHIDSRAHLVAVTEVGQAYSHGNYLVGEGLRDHGLKMEKAWSTMGDDRVSDGCRENEAAGWIPFDDAFPSGHLRPLRFPGCRCDLLLRAVT